MKNNYTDAFTLLHCKELNENLKLLLNGCNSFPSFFCFVRNNDYVYVPKEDKYVLVRLVVQD